MTLADIQAYLAAYTPSLSLTSGTNFFRSIMPSSPDVCTCIYGTGGMANEPDLGRNPAVDRAEYPTIKIVTRGTEDDFDGPNARSMAIAAALAKVGATTVTLSGTKYQAILAIQPPFERNRDENFRVYVAQNFQVYKDL